MIVIVKLDFVMFWPCCWMCMLFILCKFFLCVGCKFFLCHCDGKMRCCIKRCGKKFH